jgi:hippurate hydrolase
MPVINRLADLQPEMQEWRRDLHQYPELRFEEHRTAEQVAKLLASWGIEVHTGHRQDRRGRRAAQRRLGRASGCAPTWTRCRWTEATGLPYASKNRADACLRP